jgi:hypothetical protein
MCTFIPFLVRTFSCFYYYYLQRVYVHASPVSPEIVQLIMPNSYCFYGSLDTSMIVCLTAINFKLLCFLYWLRLFLCFEHLHYGDFVWLLPVSYILLLYNRKRTEPGTPDVKRGSECALVSYKWCGGLFCRRCNFNRWLSVAISQAGQA